MHLVGFYYKKVSLGHLIRIFEIFESFTPLLNRKDESELQAICLRHSPQFLVFSWQWHIRIPPVFEIMNSKASSYAACFWMQSLLSLVWWHIPCDTSKRRAVILSLRRWNEIMHFPFPFRPYPFFSPLEIIHIDTFTRAFPYVSQEFLILKCIT